MIIDEPNISIEMKTNEQNIQSIKTWAYNISDQIRYLSNQVEALREEVKNLKESED